MNDSPEATTRRRRLTLPILLAGAAIASIVWAAAATVEMEVVGVRWNAAQQAFEVTAGHPGFRTPASFALGADVFEGAEFFAQLQGARPGSVFSIQGPRGHAMEARAITGHEAGAAPRLGPPPERIPPGRPLGERQ